VSVSAIRDGLAKNLRTISGLRVYAEIPDSPNIPGAIVSLNNINYDQAFQRGLTEYNFVITVIVGRVSDRLAQRRIDQYVSGGENSIKYAVESDKSLDGSAFDVRVSEMTNIGAVVLNQDVTYMAADFAVTVFAE
jgi:hypothetical protein